MKTSIFAFLLSLSTLLGATRSPDSSGKNCSGFFEKGGTKWYAGAGVSVADLFYYHHHQQNNLPAGAFSENNLDEESTVSAPSLGYNVFLGYSFNDYIDLELKGVQILRPFKNSHTSYKLLEDDVNDNIAGTTKLYVVTFGPYVLINLPLYQALTPYFRFGIVTDLVSFKRKATDIFSLDSASARQSGSHKEYMWTEKLNVGMGFKSTWKDTFALKLEYEMPLSSAISGRSTVNSTGIYVPGILSASFLFEF